MSTYRERFHSFDVFPGCFGRLVVGVVEFGATGEVSVPVN